MTSWHSEATVSFIVVSFAAGQGVTAVSNAAGDAFDISDDIVAVVERVGFPVQARGGGYLLLHGTSVGKVSSSAKAWAALRHVADAELLMFIFDDEDRCVACQIQWHSGRIAVRMNLEGAPDDDVRVAMRRVNLLLDTLPDVEVEASVAVTSLGV